MLTGSPFLSEIEAIERVVGAKGGVTSPLADEMEIDSKLTSIEANGIRRCDQDLFSVEMEPWQAKLEVLCKDFKIEPVPRDPA